MTQVSEIDVDEFHFVLKCVDDCDNIDQLNLLCRRIKNEISNKSSVWTTRSDLVDQLREACKHQAELLKRFESVEFI